MNNALENHDCPPLMSDGRQFTDYRSSCYVHDLILKQNQITNSYDLKLLLTNRALELQKINREYYESKNSCMSCGECSVPDPNGHINYWNRYGEWLGYGSSTVEYLQFQLDYHQFLSVQENWMIKNKIFEINI